MKIRSLGLGGEIYRRLGAVPLTTSPGEIITGLQSGLVDGAEFVGPGSDIALGLYRLAPNYYGPGFNKPNGTGECIVALKVWETLDAQQKAIVTHACAAEAAFALNEMERLNVEALAALTEQHNVKLRTFPAGDDRSRARPREGHHRRDCRQERDRAKGRGVLHRFSRARRQMGERLGEGGAGFARRHVTRSGRSTHGISQRAAERQVDPHAAELVVLAVLQFGDAVIEEPRRCRPRRRRRRGARPNFLTGSLRFSPPNWKVAGSPSETETIGWARSRSFLS